MNVKYYLKNVDGLIIPTRANKTDAGYDVTATSGPKIIGVSYDPAYVSQSGKYRSIDYVEYETNLYFVPSFGLHVKSETHFHTDLRPRSSISSKTNFVMANSIGLIDRGYHNQVLVRFKYVWQPMDFSDNGHNNEIEGKPNTEKMYKKGDKIAQILPMTTHNIDFQLIEFLPGEDRKGGFGSTGN